MFLTFFKNLNSSVFIKKKQKQSFMVPKAPHRFKLSKHLLKFEEYEILVSLKLPTLYQEVSGRGECRVILKRLLGVFRRVDSSIASLKSIKVNLNTYCKKLLKG